MNDPSLNELLKWSVENSAASQNDPSSQTQSARNPQGLSTDALNALLGGPSDADLMRESMAAILNPEQSLENKLVAFDNFEQLVENMDNANNMEPLGLWTPLVDQLKHQEHDMRMMAAWCLGTAVQNNVRAQEKLLDLGAIPTLVNLAIDDTNQAVRKKAILALSSGIRNYQPALDAAVESLPEDHKVEGKFDATDMELVDTVIQKLRDNSAQKG